MTIVIVWLLDRYSLAARLVSQLLSVLKFNLNSTSVVSFSKRQSFEAKICLS